MSFIKKILDKISYLICFFISFDKDGIDVYFSIFNWENYFFIKWRDKIKKYKKYTIFKIHKNFVDIILTFSKDLNTEISFKTAFIEDNCFGLGCKFAILGLQFSADICIKFLHILYFILLILLGYGIYWSYITYM